MAKQWVAIVLNEDRPLGAAPDPRQHWHKGDLYSVGTSVDPTALPPYFDVVQLAGEPRPSERWDPVSRTFVDVSDLPE